MLRKQSTLLWAPKHLLVLLLFTKGDSEKYAQEGVVCIALM